MRTVLSVALLCLTMSALNGCASIRAKNNIVCFPPWDFADPAIMELNASNWGKVVGIACLCDPENKACKD